MVSASSASRKRKSKRPNILFIQADQLQRGILGCYANEIVQTPNIDALAADGVRFENAFTCTGVCTPARGALLSGMYPHKSGMIFNPELPGTRMGPRLCEYDQQIEPFSGILKDKGYDLYNIGKWHIGSWFGSKPRQYGFKGQFYPGYGYPRDHKHFLKYLSKFGLNGFKLKAEKPVRDDGFAYMSEQIDAPAEASIPGYLCSQTIDAIKKNSKTDDPFFIELNFWGPHVPINIPKEFLHMYNPDDMTLPENMWNIDDNRPAIIERIHRTWGGKLLDEKMVKRIIAAYYGYVSLIDNQIGRVLEVLKASGEADNTVIIFTSDHGSTLGAHGLQDKGLNMYDEVYRIPMIISGPKVAKKGKVYKDFVITMDMTSTFVDIAGGKIPDSYDGISLKPIIDGDLRHKTRKEVVCEAFGHQVPFIQRMVRDRKYKYIFNPASFDEFYDIQNDPFEKTNLIDTADEKLLNKYRRKLQKWGDENDDRFAGKYFKSMTRERAHK